MSKKGLLIEGLRLTRAPWESVGAQPPPNYIQFTLTLKGIGGICVLSTPERHSWRAARLGEVAVATSAAARAQEGKARRSYGNGYCGGTVSMDRLD